MMIGSSKKNNGTHEGGDMTGSRLFCKDPSYAGLMTKTPEFDMVACVLATSTYIKRVISHVGMSVYTEAIEGHRTGDQEHEQRRF